MGLEVQVRIVVLSVFMVTAGFSCAAPSASLYSWQGAVQSLGQLSKQSRLEKAITVERESRWRLARNAKIFLKTPTNVPFIWLQSAQSGLSSQFLLTANRNNADYELEIGWPGLLAEDNHENQPNRHAEAEVGVLSLSELPSIKQRASLEVRITGLHDGFHETVGLLISPTLLGQAWHHPISLTHSFQALAQQLSSG